jgi:hypothetical protein
LRWLSLEDLATIEAEPVIYIVVINLPSCCCEQRGSWKRRKEAATSVNQRGGGTLWNVTKMRT